MHISYSIDSVTYLPSVLIGLFLSMAFATAMLAGGAEAGKTHGDTRGETELAESTADTTSVRIAIPQLAANTNTGPEVPMAAEPPPPSVRSERGLTEATSGAAERRKTLWMVLAVVVVVAGSYVLQRLRSRSDPP